MDEFNIIVENEEPIDVTTNIQNDFLKGDKGDIGEPNTLAIGTVEKGTEAGASIIGESPKQILNLILPKGDKGDKGDKPEKGIDYFTTEEKQEIVQEVVKEVNAFDIKIVEELPTEDIRTKVIYFVPKIDEEEQNVYDEYIYINNRWEHIGSTKVDLTDYYKKEETDEKAIVDKFTISGKTSQEGTPSPTNIVPIKNVNVYGVNEFDGELELGTIDGEGKLVASTTNVRTKNYTKVENKIVISCEQYTSQFGVFGYSTEYNFVSVLNGTVVSGGYLYEIPSNVKYIKFRTSVGNTNTSMKVKVEKGEVATPYAPYNYGFLDLNLQKDTDTQTVTLISKRLHEDDRVDEWGFNYNRNTYTITGNETIDISQTHTNTTLFRITTSTNYLSKTDYILGICSHLNFSMIWGYDKEGIYTTAKYIYLSINNSTIGGNTVEKFKTWLVNQYANGTPVTIEYELATQEKEQFNEENQTAWNTLENLLINGYTFINSSSDELQPMVTLTEHTANEIHRENVEKFKKLDSLTERNILTTTIAAKYTISTTNAEKVTLKDTMAKVGNKLNVVNGDIVIGEGIGWVKISAQVYFYEKVTADKKSIQIARNDDIVATLSQIVDVPYSGFNIAERLYEVKEGDRISLYVKGTVNDTIFNGDTATYITVEAIA